MLCEVHEQTTPSVASQIRRLTLLTYRIFVQVKIPNDIHFYVESLLLYLIEISLLLERLAPVFPIVADSIVKLADFIHNPPKKNVFCLFFL